MQFRRLRQHRAHVFAHRGHVHAHRTVARAGQGLGDGSAAHLEHVRAARGVGQDVHHTRRVQPQRLHQGQRLRKRLPVNHQRQVDRELHGGPGTQGPQVLDAAAEQFKHRTGQGQVFLPAPHEAQQAALARRPHAATHGAFQEAGPSGPYPGADLLWLGWGHRAHVDEQPPYHRRRQQAISAQVHLVECGVVDEHREHDVA